MRLAVPRRSHARGRATTRVEFVPFLDSFRELIRFQTASLFGVPLSRNWSLRSIVSWLSDPYSRSVRTLI